MKPPTRPRPLRPPQGARLARLLVLSGVILEGSASTAWAADLDGTWQASPLTVQWRIGNWPAECGPEPSGGGGPGGTTAVTTQGRELTLRGPFGTLSTAQCVSGSSDMDRVSHSTGARNWNTTCRRGPPEETTLRTRVSASIDLIQVDEAGTYRFARNGKSCTASSRKTRTFSRLSPAPQGDALIKPSHATVLAPIDQDFGLSAGDGPSDRNGPRDDEAEVAPVPLNNGAGGDNGPAAAALLGEGAPSTPVAAAPEAAPKYVLGTSPAVGPDTASTRRRNFLLSSTLIALVLAALGIFQLRRGGDRPQAVRNRPVEPNRR